ncbi:hypothetical protein BXT86_02780, partial [candidate division WOR-3 bacterium 4484_100]
MRPPYYEIENLFQKQLYLIFYKMQEPHLFIVYIIHSGEGVKRALLFGLFPFYALASVINYDVPVQDVKYQITTVDGYTRIIAPGGFSYQKPGYPELPAVGFNYLLPQGYRLKTVRVIDSIWEIIPGSFYIYPKQKEHLIGEKCQFTEPIKTIYEADTFIPGQIILSAVSGNLRGYPIAQ